VLNVRSPTKGISHIQKYKVSLKGKTNWDGRAVEHNVLFFFQKNWFCISSNSFFAEITLFTLKKKLPNIFPKISIHSKKLPGKNHRLGVSP
jgi:hypothetical protein